MTSDAMGGAGAGFARDRCGSVAIIFAAVIIPVIGIVAAAIDIGRAANVRSTLQTAVTAAAEAGSQHLGQDRSVIEGKVRAMLSANLPRELAELPHTVRVPNDNSLVEVAMAAAVPTSLMGVVGVAEIDVAVSGFARPVTTPVLNLPTDDIAQGSGLGAAGTMPPAGSMPALPPIRTSEDLRAAAGIIAERLKEVQAATGGAPHGLPPEVAAELERMMRDIGRNTR